MITRRNFVRAAALTVALAPSTRPSPIRPRRPFSKRSLPPIRARTPRASRSTATRCCGSISIPGLRPSSCKDRKDAKSAAMSRSSTAIRSSMPRSGRSVRSTSRCVTTAPDKASATVKFSNFKMPTTLVYDLVKLKGGWRIADITWQEGDGGNETLRGLFVKK